MNINQFLDTIESAAKQNLQNKAANLTLLPPDMVIALIACARIVYNTPHSLTIACTNNRVHHVPTNSLCNQCQAKEMLNKLLPSENNESL